MYMCTAFSWATRSEPREERVTIVELLLELSRAGCAIVSATGQSFHDDTRHLNELKGRSTVAHRLGQVQNLYVQEEIDGCDMGARHASTCPRITDSCCSTGRRS